MLFPHKVRERFLVLCKKEQYLYDKTKVSLNSSFLSAFLTCCFALPQPTFWLMLRGHVQWSNVDVLLLLFSLEDQIGVQCQNGFELTRYQFLYNVSSHWPFLPYSLNFCQIKYSKKCLAIYLQVLREHVSLHDFPVEQGDDIIIKFSYCLRF